MHFLSVMQKYGPVTGKIDSYICGLGMLSAVVFMGIAIPMAAYSMPLFWTTITLGEVCHVLLLMTMVPLGASSYCVKGHSTLASRMHANVAYERLA